MQGDGPFSREREFAGFLDRLGAELFAGVDAGAVLHDRVTQELSLHDGGAELRLDLPFVSKGDVSLRNGDVGLNGDGSRVSRAISSILPSRCACKTAIQRSMSIASVRQSVMVCETSG